MNIGYAQDRITPSLDRPVFLAVFGNNRRAQTAHDDLYVRALALQDERAVLVLVALDLIGFFSVDCQAVVRQVDRPEISILIASTHTHHGPDTMGLWGPDDKTRGVDPVYLEELRQKIVDTIHASLTDLQPASVKWASVHAPGLVKNARNPEIVDDELTLAQFVSGDRVLATLFNFPCHPEVLWEHNPHISADYPRLELPM